MSKIDDKYASLGGPSSFLGNPINAEAKCKSDSTWSVRDYQNGSIYFQDSADAANEIHGAIAQKYYSLNREKTFGFPVSDELILPDGFGRVSYLQGGAIYWRQTTGAFEVHGAIGNRYQFLGGPSGVLGYPASDEGDTSDSSGRMNTFEHGVIFWKNDNSAGTHEVHGAILAKWKSLGMQAGTLGYPITNEMPVASPPGARRSRFQHGTILWTPSGGAQVV